MELLGRLGAMNFKRSNAYTLCVNNWSGKLIQDHPVQQPKPELQLDIRVQVHAYTKWFFKDFDSISGSQVGRTPFRKP